jgi:hypothetical protein
MQFSNPTLYQETLEKVTPMLIDLKYIQQILNVIRGNYPDLDDTDVKILFVAVVYEIYCPASFIPKERNGKGPKSAMKAPVGIREEAAKVLGYGNAENVNGWQEISKSYMKVKSFRARVNEIKEQFRCFSVRNQDWELKFA